MSINQLYHIRKKSRKLCKENSKEILTVKAFAQAVGEADGIARERTAIAKEGGRERGGERDGK